MVKKKNNGAFPYIVMLISMIVIAILLNQPSNLSEMKMSEAIDMFKENKVEYYELNLGNGNLEIAVSRQETTVAEL